MTETRLVEEVTQRKHPLARLGPALALVVVVLAGGFLRLYHLHLVPPGLFFDEAANLFDVARVVAGAHPLYFPANNGREPLFFYWASLFARVWGTTPYALRLAAAAVGTLTIVATFVGAREAFRFWGYDRRRSEWLAVVASAVLAGTYMHVHFSRFGLRTITLPFFLVLSLGFLLRGMRRGSIRSLALAGALGGISIYTYISSRLVPALLAVPALVGGRSRFWRTTGQVLIVLMVWIVVSLPMGFYYLRHPGDVQSHTDDVSMLNPANNHGDPVGAILHGTVATLLSIDVHGSDAAEQNLPGRPILDPLVSVFFLLGLGVLAFGCVRGTFGSPGLGSRRIVAFLLVGWILDQLVTSALSVNPPGFVRITGILPALAIIAAFGLGAAYDLARRLRLRSPVAGLGVAAVLLISACWTFHDYFVVWGPSDVAYSWMMGHKVDSATWLRDLSGADRVFLAPLYAQDYTIRYLTQGASLESFDIGKSVVIPTDRSRPVDYLFPAGDADEAAIVARELPPGARTTILVDPTGRHPLLIRLEIPPNALPPVPSDRVATFRIGDADSIALIGATLDPAQPRAGETLELTLRWLALRRPPEDYTAFVHLRDGGGHTVTQLDRQPTDGSYPTSAWHAGDLVVDRYQLALPAALPPGEYRLILGLYQLKTLQRLPARLPAGDAPGAEVPIGTLRVVPR